MKEIGEVIRLIRYPIKSMQGENIESIKINQDGLIGDRKYALRDDETGYIVSAKHPKKWAKVLKCKAYFKNENLNELIVEIPENSKVYEEKEVIESKLFEFLGRKVSLIKTTINQEFREADRTPIENSGDEIIRQEPLSVASKKGHFYDYSPLHLITETSLESLREKYQEGDFSVNRFRPNLLIKTKEKGGYPEINWLGKKIRIGTRATIKIIDPSPRCLMPTLSQGELKKDIKILKTIVKQTSAESYTLLPGTKFKGVLGIYGKIEEEGTVKIGDKIYMVE